MLYPAGVFSGCGGVNSLVQRFQNIWINVLYRQTFGAGI